MNSLCSSIYFRKNCYTNLISYFCYQKQSTYTDYIDNVKSTFASAANGAISAMKTAMSKAKSVVNGVSPSTYTSPINSAIT